MPPNCQPTNPTHGGTAASQPLKSTKHYEAISNYKYYILQSTYRNIKWFDTLQHLCDNYNSKFDWGFAHCNTIYLDLSFNFKELIQSKGNKIWVIVVFFGAQALKMIGTGMQAWGKNLKGEESALELLISSKVIFTVIFIIVGIIIWILNKGFGRVIEHTKPETMK